MGECSARSAVAMGRAHCMLLLIFLVIRCKGQSYGSNYGATNYGGSNYGVFQRPANPPPPGYSTLEEVHQRMTICARTYSNVAQWVNLTNWLSDVGAPRTFQGRDLFALRLSSNVPAQKASDKPAYLLNAAIHARELGAAEAALSFAERLAALYGRDQQITEFLEEAEMWVIPVANVDGYEFVFQDNLWRKNRSPTRGSPYIGVDLNRNFPFRFGPDEACTGSLDASAETFRGASGGSERESQLLMALTHDLRFAKLIDLHNFGPHVVYGFCDGTAPHHFQGWLEEQAMSISNGAFSGLMGDANYAKRKTPDSNSEFYTWHQAQYDALSFLIEIGVVDEYGNGNGEFQTSFDEARYMANSIFGSLLNFFSAPLPLTGHVRDQNEVPLEASFSIQGVQVDRTTTFSSRPDNGRYFLHAPPGSYTLRFERPGYEVSVVDVTIRKGGSYLDVILRPVATEAPPPRRNADVTLRPAATEPAPTRRNRNRNNYGVSTGDSYGSYPSYSSNNNNNDYNNNYNVYSYFNGNSYNAYMNAFAYAKNGNSPSSSSSSFSTSPSGYPSNSYYSNAYSSYPSTNNYASNPNNDYNYPNTYSTLYSSSYPGSYGGSPSYLGSSRYGSPAGSYYSNVYPTAYPYSGYASSSNAYSNSLASSSYPATSSSSYPGYSSSSYPGYPSLSYPATPSSAYPGSYLSSSYPATPSSSYPGYSSSSSYPASTTSYPSYPSSSNEELTKQWSRYMYYPTTSAPHDDLDGYSPWDPDNQPNYHHDNYREENFDSWVSPDSTVTNENDEDEYNNDNNNNNNNDYNGWPASFTNSNNDYNPWEPDGKLKENFVPDSVFVLPTKADGRRRRRR